MTGDAAAATTTHRMILGTLRPTRRALALLTLAFGALAPTADVACPMAETGAASDVTAAAHEEHGHAHHGSGAADDAEAHRSADPGSEDHGSAPTCMRITGCGASGLASPFRARTTLPAALSAALDLATPDRYRTTFPAHEPPPPRLHV